MLNDADRMDRHYRYQRHIYDWSRTYYLLGRRHLIANLEPRPGQSVLEVGCGTAWNLLNAARAYPQARLHGFDVSNAMLEVARANAARQAMSGRLRLAQGDATNFEPSSAFGTATFDRVFISYALSMIPRWQDALDHAARMVAPGGRLHIVDFGQCEALPPVFRRILFAFLRHYTVVPRADLQSILIDVARRHRLGLEFTPLYRGYSAYAVLTRAA